MSLKNKVIWSEGMFLQQQHFQQQDRYFERLVHTRLSSVGSALWGVFDYALDKEALMLGKVSLSEISGIFPDGTPISAPDFEGLPAVIDIPENTRDQLVYLCIPMQQLGSQEFAREEEKIPQARYQMSNYEIRDTASASGQTARLQVGKLSTCFKLSSEDLSGYVCIAIARIFERLPGKPIKLDKEFIPPLLDCNQHSIFKAYFEEITGLLKQRGDALSNRLTDSGRAGSAEIADYLLLQVINRTEPLIKHLKNLVGLHPLKLYEELVQLAGELSTFTESQKRPREIAPYLHSDLQKTFLSVFAALRYSLSMVLEQTAVALELTASKYGIYVSPIQDPSLVKTASFFVAVKADMPADVLRTRFPSQVRIAPVEKIRDLISAQLPGLAVRPLPVAPRQIPYHAGFTYFEIDRQGDLWQTMQNTGGFALHLGQDYPGITIELWAVRI